jgi:hypothetical protein
VDGVYAIPYLFPGVYNIEISAPGFQALKREGITLDAAKKLDLPIQLTIGQSTTEVTVVGQQEVIDTADADHGVLFDPLKTQELPLNGRQSYMLMMLTPGVLFTTFTFGPTGNSGTRAWDITSAYKFNGARSGNGNNTFLMNGAPVSDYGSTWDFAPSVDSIEEFRVSTTTFDAQYGREAGGVVNTVIKSGTNVWHGDVYDYWRNSIFDANNMQNNLSGASKAGHNQHQFGGVFGGPIRKNKDFLFASYEGWQEVIPFSASATLPPVDLRDGQHFSEYGMTVYDPLTIHPCTAGSGAASTEPCSGSNGSAYWETPFPGDVIPKSRISPIAQAILAYLPAPNTPGVNGTFTNNFISTDNKGRYWYNQPIVHWDHVFSDRDKFSALFSEFHGFEYRSVNGFQPPLAVGNTYNNRTFTSLNLDETHTISSTAVLDLRANWYRFVQWSPGYTTPARDITPQSIGMTNMVEAPTVSDKVIPNFTIGSFGGSGASQFFGSGSYTFTPYDSWDFMPSVTWTKGRHSFQFGGEFRYEQRGNVSPGDAYGNFGFSSTFTRAASDRSLNSTDQYNSIASMLLGLPGSGDIANNATSYVTRPYYGVYANDTWRVTQRFTVTIGLRWDVQVPWLERYNRGISQFNINAISPDNAQILANWNADAAAYNSNPANKYAYPAAPSAIYGSYEYAGQNGFPRRQQYTDFTNGAPRIGFAYRALDKTVIRAGFGTYYQSLTSSGASQTGFSQSTSYQPTLGPGQIPAACLNNGCAGGPPTGPYSLVNPFPNGLTAAQGNTFAVSQGIANNSNLGSGASAISLHYKVPRTYQYNLGIQQQLPWNMVFDISFAGNWAGYTQQSIDIGSPANAAGLANYATAITDPTFFSRSIANPFANIANCPLTASRCANSTISASSLINAYPLWGGMSNNDIAGEWFRSDALQVRFEKRALGNNNSAAGTLTLIFTGVLSKEYLLSCCQAQTWETNTGASLIMNGNGNGGLTSTLGPVVSVPPAAEWRYAMDSNNQTYQFAFSGVWDLPVGRAKHFGNGVTGVADKLLSNWTIDWAYQWVSGEPLGLPTLWNFCGNWNNPQGTQFNAWFNNTTSCYAQYPTNTSGFTYLPPRWEGKVNNPTAGQLNFAVVKNIAFKERYKLQIRGEAFNLTNTPIRSGPSTSLTSGTFGIVPAFQNNFPRLVQLAAKLFF